MTEESGSRDGAPLEALTLAQLCGRLLRQPRHTLSDLRRILRAEPVDAARLERVTLQQGKPAAAVPSGTARTAAAAGSLGLRLLALILALWGSHILVPESARRDSELLARGALFLLPALALWVLADAFYPWPRHLTRERNLPHAASPVAAPGKRGQRLLAAFAGVLCCWLAWRFTAHNSFTLIGLGAWLASVLLWLRALTPGSLDLRAWWRGLPLWLERARWSRRETLALGLILVLAAGLRLWQLDTVMPEMSSDHVEKIRDAWRVSRGEHNVFFANIGGREPLQMYAMALLAQLPGLGFNFYTLKLLTALEGVVAVLLLTLTGRTLIGGREGRLVGLIMGALVAVGYWHILLSRMGLRIVLTTSVAALLLLILWRALRHNRRRDFLAAGLVIGFGLYTYQAARMLPLVVVTGAGLILIWRASGLRLALLCNFAALVLIALVAFVPLAGYALEYPQDFWRRTTSRVLGDAALASDTVSGLEAQLAAVSDELAQLAVNLRNALLMFNWKGDVAWISGAPNKPALDPWTGALFILGLGAWARRIQRRRSVLELLLPVSLFIMLLPSVLALAFPVENPSHTRTSGAIPAVFLIAALPLAQLAGLLRQQLRGRLGRLCAAGLVLVVLTGAMSECYKRYFVENLHSWEQATFPYSTAGQVLSAFVAVTDAPGNAFMVGWPHWWDHRAVGIEAGLQEWPNAALDIEHIPYFLGRALKREGAYRLDPDRGLLFLLSPEDELAVTRLRAWFPNGQLQLRRSELARHEFLLYQVASAGEATLRQLVDEGT